MGKKNASEEDMGKKRETRQSASEDETEKYNSIFILLLFII
jgi:hypothetical protein